MPAGLSINCLFAKRLHEGNLSEFLKKDPPGLIVVGKNRIRLDCTKLLSAASTASSPSPASLHPLPVALDLQPHENIPASFAENGTGEDDSQGVVLPQAAQSAPAPTSDADASISAITDESSQRDSSSSPAEMHTAAVLASEDEDLLSEEEDILTEEEEFLSQEEDFLSQEEDQPTEDLDMPARSVLPGIDEALEAWYPDTAPEARARRAYARIVYQYGQLVGKDAVRIDWQLLGMFLGCY